jgi:hypothetical protein
MGNQLELVKNDDELLDREEIQRRLGISKDTFYELRTFGEIEPAELKINTQGSKTPLYSLLSFLLQKETYTDKSHIEALSPKSKMKFLIGHVELEGTEEQRTAIRDMIDAKDARIKNLESECDSMMTIATENNREYERVLKRLPKSELTHEQRKWLSARWGSEYPK